MPTTYTISCTAQQSQRPPHIPALLYYPAPFATLSSRPHKLIQAPIKLVASNRHLQRIKRILHHKIRVQLVALLDDDIDICLGRLREQQELDSRRRLEAAQAEVRRFQDFETRGP